VSDDKALAVEFPDADAQSAFLEGVHILWQDSKATAHK
jgi:hypothetical protein